MCNRFFSARFYSIFKFGLVCLTAGLLLSGLLALMPPMYADQTGPVDSSSPVGAPVLSTLLALRDAPLSTGAERLAERDGRSVAEDAGAVDLPPDASTDWWTAAQRDIRRSEYHVTWQDHTCLDDVPADYQAPNRAHDLRTYFTPSGVRVIPRTELDAWEWGLTLTDYGYAGDLQPVAAAQLTVAENRVEYRYPDLSGFENLTGLVEWYVNDENGLEQGFTINQRQPITIDPLATSPSWTAESDQASVRFGYSVGTAGDVNGDGYSDVIVGARVYDGGQMNENRVLSSVDNLIAVRGAKLKAPGGRLNPTIFNYDYADCSVSGVVTSGIWSGVITMTGDVVIAAGEVVTIAPGTKVYATTTSDYNAPEGTNSRVELIVSGALVADGTTSHPITLTSVADIPAQADWYGVRFLSGSDGFITYTIIEYGVHALSLSDNTALIVNHSTIRENRHETTSGSGYAAGIYASGNFTLTLEESLLVDNRVHVRSPSSGNVYGGHIYLNGGNTIISRTQILTSTGVLWSYMGYARGGGIYATGNGTLTIENSRISGIRVHGDRDSVGGGLFLNNTRSVIQDTVIADNRAEDEWGGTTRGGGIYISNGTLVTITDSTIERNRAWRYSYNVGTQGGGIYSAGDLFLSRCNVRDNLMRPYGSSMVGHGAGIYIAGGTANVESCIVSGNEITSTNRPGYGGGLYVNSGQVWVVNTLIANNRLTPSAGASYGGGVYVNGGTVSLINDTIVGNQVDNDGGGVYFAGNGGITNTIIVSNTANISGGGIFSGSGDMSLGYNDVWNNNGGNYYPSAITGTNDISTDPLFSGYSGVESSDYHLVLGSPCIDAGTPNGAPDNDFDGDLRPMGDGYDIGFDELVPTFYTCTPETRDSDVVLVVDRSGSMDDDDKLIDAQAAVSVFLDTLDAPPEQAALASFALSSTLDAPLTTNVELVRAAVMSLTAGGETHIDLGLAEARAELASSRHVVTHTKVIILLSDGQQTGSTAPVLAEADAAKAEGALIFSIGLGPDADADLLQQVASDPAYYFYAPGGEDLEDIYLFISTVIACPDIGGRTFVDWDADGTYTAGLDDPLGDVEIQLAGGAETLTATTDLVSGTYLFAANPSGRYTITVDLSSVPAGYQPTTATLRYVDLLYRDDLGNDFGLLPPSNLTLTKTVTPTQLPHAGGWVTYTLFISNSGGTPLSPVTVTDPLLGGLLCINPPGQDPLLPGDGFACHTTTLILTDTINTATATGIPAAPNGAPISGTTAVSDTAQATVTLGWSAIGGRVFADWDQDGSYSAGTDTALAGVEIELQAEGSSDTTTSKSPDGLYRFPFRSAGVYTLALNLTSVPAGYQATTPISRALELTTQDQLDHDFGLYAPWGVSLEKSASPTELPHDGGWVTYTFRVSNTGQTPLASLMVDDPLLGGLVCTNPLGQDPLTPGDGFTCHTTTLILTNTFNVATVSGVPLQVDGQPIPGGVVSAGDGAVVTLGAPPEPELTIDKDTLTPLVAPGGEVTYTIVVRNQGAGAARELRVKDALPTSEWSYLDGSVEEQNAVRTQSVDPQVGDTLLEWGEWTLEAFGALTLTLRVQVGSAVPEGSYDNTAGLDSLETGWLDDEGKVGGDAGTPAGQDPETDEDVTIVASSPQEHFLYLPLLLRNYAPPVTFPLHVGDAIPERPVAYQGEVFYTLGLHIPDELPGSGRFYLSSQEDAVTKVLVDDVLALLLDGSEVFAHNFSSDSHPPEPAIVEIPRTTMEMIAGRTVTIEYRDVYGAIVEASVMWWIWTP